MQASCADHDAFPPFRNRKPMVAMSPARQKELQSNSPSSKYKAPRCRRNNHPTPDLTPVTSPTTAATVPRDRAGRAQGESPVTCHFTVCRSAAH